MKQILLLEIDSLGREYLIYLTESKSFYAVIREYQPDSHYPVEYTTLYHETLDEVLHSLDINVSEEERNKINEVIEAYPDVIWEEDRLKYIFKSNLITFEQAKAIADRYLNFNKKAIITRPVHIHIPPEEGDRVKELADKAFKKLAEQMKNKGGDLQ